MTLSILICTLPERHQMLQRLEKILEPQLKRFPEVEVVKHDAGRGMTTGEKRNWLMSHSSGEYLCYVDDDDWLPNYYCIEMLEAIKQKPDVVTFNGWMTTNGANRKNFEIKLGNPYKETADKYLRFPNHLCAFRRDVVGHVLFPHITIQEDFLWAKVIHDRGLCKTSVHIERDMYHYDYRSKKR